LRVFSDKTSLSASPHLWPSIEAALSRSRFFVLLASPEAAASPWIEQEVRWWRDHRDQDTLLIALTAGALDWDRASGTFADTATVPPALRNWAGVEPLWVDLRWARNERDLSMRNPRFRDAVGDLAAPLHGKPKDELIGEDISQHRRTVRLARAAVALLVLMLAAALVGGVLALVQRAAANREKTLAFARELAAESAIQRQRDPQLALLLGAEAVRVQAMPETESALRKALSADHLRAVFPVGERELRSLEFSPDGSELLVAGGHGRAQIFDVSSGSVVQAFRAGPPAIDSASFARDGQLVLTTDALSSSKLWSATSGQLLRSLPDGRSEVMTGAISPDGRRIATVTHRAHLWTGDGASLGPIGTPRNRIEDVAFAPSSRLLATVDWLGGIRVRRLDREREGPRMYTGEALSGMSINFVSPRTLLAVGGEVRKWNAISGRSKKLTGLGEGFYAQEHTAADMSSNGLLVFGSGDGTLAVRDLAHRGRGFTTQTAGREVTALDISPDGRLIATAQADGTLRLFAIKPHDGMVSALGPKEAASSVTISDDGRLLAATYRPNIGFPLGSTSKLIHGTTVWRLADGKQLWTVGANGDTTSAFSPDGRLLAISGEDGTTVWPLFSSRPSLRFAAPSWDAAFSPDGALLAIAERDRVRVRRVSDGRLVEALPSRGEFGVGDVAFSPDGSDLLVVAGEETIKIYHRGERKPVREFGKGPLWFVEAVYSPDGKRIAAISDTRLVVINPETGAMQWSAPVGSFQLASVRYSPDGRRILVTSEDGRAVVFDAESLLEVDQFVPSTWSLESAAFGADSETMALAGEDGVRIFRCDLCAPASGLLALAQEDALGGLSPTQQRRYLHR
jgi:WD40 repeat protein